MSESKLQWEDPVWLKQVYEWIHAEASKHNIKITGDIEQPHIYPWSTVLRIPTDGGTLFFKATAQETVYESALTQKLAEWYPQCMPELVATETSIGWMLMRDGGERLREFIRPTKDITPWNPTIKLFSEVQVGCVERVSELLALGIPDWRLTHLPQLYSELLADEDSIRVDQDKGLTSEEFRRVQELHPRFVQICHKLAAFGIPETLNHGDFHDGNVLVKDGRVTLFDWGDACVAHPFISLRTFFVSIENSLELDDYAFTPEMQGLLEIYFEPWQKFAPKEKLQEAYFLSQCVASIVRALAWHQTIAPLKNPLREEYAHIVPELFREFIEHEKKL
ncbi:MAG: aminoglycoside phosphotransferase family protein [Anaerolineales bacterium]|nr:aminoglycoside phosphotransferase family protein [Anaerolineales bacterium]